MKVAYTDKIDQEKSRWVRIARDKDDVDRYRILKELASKAGDHEREQAFFAMELKAKRYYETTGPALWLSYLYEWVSDFGRSLWRPLLGLGVLWVVFGWVYAQLATQSVGNAWEHGLKLSASVLVPFVAAARTSYREAKDVLFGVNETTDLLLDVFVITEGIFGLAFVFLIGLALRNRFRI